MYSRYPAGMFAVAASVFPVSRSIRSSEQLNFAAMESSHSGSCRIDSCLVQPNCGACNSVDSRHSGRTSTFDAKLFAQYLDLHRSISNSLTLALELQSLPIRAERWLTSWNVPLTATHSVLGFLTEWDHGDESPYDDHNRQTNEKFQPFDHGKRHSYSRYTQMLIARCGLT